MEYRKQIISDGTGDSKAVLLRPGQGVIYDLRILRWTLQLAASQADNASVDVALSTREEDQNDAPSVGVTLEEIYEAPGIFFPFHWFGEHPSDIGIANHNYHDTLTFPEPYTVPFLAGVSQETIGVGSRLLIELWYDRRRASAWEAAHLVLGAGGRARS